jgi:hypothetical protein
VRTRYVLVVDPSPLSIYIMVSKELLCDEGASNLLRQTLMTSTRSLTVILSPYIDISGSHTAMSSALTTNCATSYAEVKHTQAKFCAASNVGTKAVMFRGLAI